MEQHFFRRRNLRGFSLLIFCALQTSKWRLLVQAFRWSASMIVTWNGFIHFRRMKINSRRHQSCLRNVSRAQQLKIKPWERFSIDFLTLYTTYDYPCVLSRFQLSRRENSIFWLIRTNFCRKWAIYRIRTRIGSGDGQISCPDNFSKNFRGCVQSGQILALAVRTKIPQSVYGPFYHCRGS